MRGRCCSCSHFTRIKGYPANRCGAIKSKVTGNHDWLPPGIEFIFCPCPRYNKAGRAAQPTGKRELSL